MFRQSCFIRKNTPELRKKLEELGYTLGVCPHAKYGEDKFDWDIHLFENKYHFRPYELYGLKNNIDCGTNEELFLALAALRDDTDKNQWFVNTKNDWYLCKDNKFCKETADWLLVISADNWHKATVGEIIEHFNDK